MTKTQTIYVELLDEGVVVYRPVEATPNPDGVLRLPAPAPADELGVVHWRLMKQKQYSSMPPEPSPGARKCSLSTMWLWPPTKGL
jgi:hypothetical protein